MSLCFRPGPHRAEGSVRAASLRRAAAGLLAALTAAAASGGRLARGAEAPPARGPLDAPLALEAEPPGEACGWSGRTADEPLPVVVDLHPASLDDPSFLESLASCAPARRLRIVARLLPPEGWEGEPDPRAALAPWKERLERFVQARRRDVAAYVLGRRPELVFEPRAYAFLAESVGTILRSIDPDAVLHVGDLGEGAGPWLDRIPAARLAPYVHGFALEDPVDLSSWMARLARDYPGRPVWLRAGGEGADPSRFLERLAAARAAGVRMVVAAGARGPDLTRLLLNLVQTLPARFVVDLDPPVVAVHAPPRGPGDGGAPGRRPPPQPLAHFADPLGPERAVLLPGAGGASGGAGAIRVSIGPDPIRSARAFDLGAGVERATLLAHAGGEGGPAVMDVAYVEGPLLLRYVAATGLRAAPEVVGVTAEYELTAEEIIARQRAFDASQDRALDHYTARATISYHYRAEALNEAVDVTSVHRFYWRAGVGEFEQTELFINGARWRGPEPSLPFIMPEKVKEVPIEIRLDESYTYRLVGREELGGHPCYVLSFEPLHDERSLYSGRVWVDERTFAKRRIHLVQRGLKDPITSNVDEIEYGTVEGPERSHWLPLRVYRQMVFTVLGRSVAVETLLRYEDFVVDGPDFDQARETAYASGRTILRDDEEGYAFVERGTDGTFVRRAVSRRNVAFFGGIGFSAEPSLGTPFAGLNYFDFDWRGTGTQIDVAFAGPFVNVAWTDPRLGESRWELSVEGRFIGLKDRFKRVTDAGRRDGEDLKVLEERAFATLARPAGPYVKAEFQVELGYDNFDRAEHTGEGFVLPATAPSATATARLKHHRGGYILDVWASGGRRFGWEDWGLEGAGGGEGSEDSFQRWGAGLLKSFYPGRLQKVSLTGSLLAGRRMDRFSRYRIGDFRNVRVVGYNGADITFDRGATAAANYLFALPRGGASVDVGVQGALIENEEDFGVWPLSPRSSTARTRRHLRADGIRERVAGGAIGLSFGGPWGTLVSVRGGWSLGTSMNIGGTSGSFRLVVIKTFDGWPWSRKQGDGPAPLPGAP